MAGLGDVSDVLRGAGASLAGFSGRLVARTVLMIIAGRAFGIEALGVLAQVAAVTEIAAAIGVMGLKRGLLDILSFEEKNGRAPQPCIIEALGVALVFSIMISAILLVIWRIILPHEAGLATLMFFAVPAIVFTDVSLSAIKHKRIIGWDVWSRGVAEPWGFLGLTLAFLALGVTGYGLIIAYVGSIFIAAALSAIGLARSYGLRTLVGSRPSLSRALTIPQKSIPIGITDIGVMALRRVDLIVLSIFAGAEGAGLYYMVQQLATIPQKTFALFEPMLSPVIARLHNHLDAKKIRANLVGVCRWVLIIQLAISIPMMVFGDALLEIFGSSFALGATVLVIILFAELVDGSFLAVETPLVYARPGLPPKLIGAVLLLEISLIAALSQLWGAEGAAVGFLITMIALAAGRLLMAKKYLDIAVLNISYFTPLALAALTAGALLLTRWRIAPDQGVMIGVLMVASVVIFLSLIGKFALTKTDKILMDAFLLHRRRKRRLASI
ncbi:MAG: oligosaccharide flippase family protein [Marinicaulis sp.]|nr:oligosaccharide flippase family protein [Marinicaulis sp.]